MAEAVMDMPRSCSIPIQSEAVVLPPLRPRTMPAVRIRPEYKRSFSVNVVLPASGWLMMAKVRLRAVAAASSLSEVVSVVMMRGAAYHIVWEGDDSHPVRVDSCVRFVDGYEQCLKFLVPS